MTCRPLRPPFRDDSNLLLYPSQRLLADYLGTVLVQTVQPQRHATAGCSHFCKRHTLSMLDIPCSDNISSLRLYQPAQSLCTRNHMCSLNTDAALSHPILPPSKPKCSPCGPLRQSPAWMLRHCHARPGTRPSRCHRPTHGTCPGSCGPE